MATAQIISYEEYYPYGSTSYQAGRSAAEVSLKRYRYTGMERDEETGLYHPRGAVTTRRGWVLDQRGPWRSSRWTQRLRLRPSAPDRFGRSVRNAMAHPNQDEPGAAGAPLPTPKPDYVDPGGEAIYLMTRRAATPGARRIAGGRVRLPPPRDAGVVPTTGGKDVQAYIHQEPRQERKACAVPRSGHRNGSRSNCYCREQVQSEKSSNDLEHDQWSRTKNRKVRKVRRCILPWRLHSRRRLHSPARRPVGPSFDSPTESTGQAANNRESRKLFPSEPLSIPPSPAAGTPNPPVREIPFDVDIGEGQADQLVCERNL